MKYRMLDCSKQHLPIRYNVSHMQWDAMSDDEQRAFVAERGIRVNCSTFIDEVTITAGFGRLNDLGWFEYTCPWKMRELNAKEG